MRDLETIESALRIAETGHLTFATLHTNSAASTINRIIDVFPAHQQPQIRAQLSMAGLMRQLGQPREAAALRLRALQLRARFLERFWDPERRILALALDGVGDPCLVRSSNMGHALWGQLVSPEQAEALADHLLSPEMFSGYGIRTLADVETAYNPLSYHNGSIWPHDNSIIMEGLRYYRLERHLERACGGLLDVLETSVDFRLPELFCGFRRREDAPPVPYEVACKPQAWAAGSVFLMLKAMLGMSMEVDQDYLVLQSPLLTSRIGELEIRGLQVRGTELDLVFRQTAAGARVEVVKRSGDLRVLTVK